MQIIRVHDPERRPPSWTAVIRPGQFVAFAKFADGGGSSDADGRPFASPAATTCVLFDTLDEARAFCEERVRTHPDLLFEVFDSAGRANPPLIVVVNPARAQDQDSSQRTVRRRTVAAIALVAGALALFWIDYSQERDLLILPTIVGVNMLLAAGRLLQMNSAIVAGERTRRQRLDQASKER